MTSLAEIEAAVDSLPPQQQELLLRHIADRLQQSSQRKANLPFIPASGRQITQEEIDDACDAD
jgi:hypothetical protein